MNIRPLYDRILVKRKKNEDKTQGGIWIPETAKQLLFEGTVVAVGNGKALKDGSFHPLDVKVGDKILFGKYTGTEVVDPEDGGRLVVLREDDLHGVFEE